MALVDYSDSDESENEQPLPQEPVPKEKSTAATTKFAVDKSSPRKIRINLQETEQLQPAQRQSDGEPALKKARTGEGIFSGFNAMLPPPKRAVEITPKASSSAKGIQPRKVFSLRTGAEPGFSRESDAELRELFAEHNATRDESNDRRGNEVKTNAAQAETISVQNGLSDVPRVGNAMIFKPLSVARNPHKKKKIAVAVAKSAPPETAATGSKTHPSTLNAPPQKFSLFSAEMNTVSANQSQPEDIEEYVEGEGDFVEEGVTPELNTTVHNTSTASLQTTQLPQTQSLEAIASDLNLSAAARRQLLGRHARSSDTAINIVNFNTDAEYAANEVFRASGEQVQHNPVRSIAPGKHSLKQLVSAASGQKDALEESFATGKRNKKEAGNKYGW